MGFLKTSGNTAGGSLISCENVLDVAATIATTNLTVKILYNQPIGSADKVIMAELVYTSGGSNEMELTAAEYQTIFQDAVVSMSGVSCSAVNLPIVNNKVTATGAVIGAVTPTYELKLSGAIT